MQWALFALWLNEYTYKMLQRCHWQCGQISLFTNVDDSRCCYTVYAAVLAQLVYQGFAGGIFNG
jgi:hypothetical protein